MPSATPSGALAMVWIFGRTQRWSDMPRLAGPIGAEIIGDAHEGLTVERTAKNGGLTPDFSALACNGFDQARAHPLVREFYEHMTRFSLDVWIKTDFPSSLGVWLLVTTISRPQTRPEP